VMTLVSILGLLLRSELKKYTDAIPYPLREKEATTV